MTRITHLEDALYADAQGGMRDQLLGKLAHTQAQLSEQLRMPQPPEAFRALGQCLEACVSASATIEVLWQRYHFPGGMKGGAPSSPSTRN
ncbi:EscE/YscE/SsaE family type III secretion system needle protein co-chaperone [Pseudomonas sp. MDT1-17]